MKDPFTPTRYGIMELRAPECAVRDFRPEDAASLARHGTNRRIWLNLRDRFPHPYTEAGASAYIAFVLSHPEHTSWVIDVGGEAVGGIALHPREDIERIGAEIGYWLGEAHWGKGVATAAIRLVTDHAFNERSLIRVFAIPFTANAASCRALEKAGYQREGIMRKSAIKDGQVLDQFLYAAVRG
jgi:ribosomal-protein-alanine N-acetyltransferase